MLLVLETPTLRHVALVKTVTELWNQRDILSQIAQVFNGQHRDALIEEAEEWKEMEEKVKSKVPVLTLPQTCKEDLFNLIKPIGEEIFGWCRYHSSYIGCFQFVDILLLNQLRWTMRGTVDYAKTAEVIAKDERVAIGRRYEIACVRCLEEDARKLFQLLPEHKKREYIDKVRFYWNVEHRNLIVYFTCTFNGRADLLNNYFSPTPEESINKRLFTDMLYSDNRATFDYFFNKLDPDEKEQVLEERKMWRFKRSSHLLVHYLSLMNEAQLRRACLGDMHAVLISLLRWPLQPLFTEAAQYGRQFLNEFGWADVLSAIGVKIHSGYKDYDYRQLFRECLRLIPAEYKQPFLTQEYFLRGLLASKEEELVKLILDEASSRGIMIVSDRMSGMLLDESVISDVALLGYKEKAALESSNDKEDEEKRSRSQQISQLVDRVM